MLPLVIIKQKPNFQKWNIQKTIVCILGSSQRASFPKSAASEESGQRPVPRVGAYQGPGKRPLGHCFLFYSLYVVENLPCFNPSKSFPPHGSERESHMGNDPQLLCKSHLPLLLLGIAKATEGLRQTKGGSSIHGFSLILSGAQGLGQKTQQDLCTGSHCTLTWKTMGTSGSLWDKIACYK